MKLKVSWASSRNRRKENQDKLSIGEQAAFPEGIEERHISGQVTAVADGAVAVHMAEKYIAENR